ncbi:MAG: nucleoside deaminase [Clostridia bacterium]|nr:nucleoside deaminase [Clostridia bacterium]
MIERDRQLQFMRLALEEAMKSQDEVPVGAVVVFDGQVIAAAHNERETAENDPFGHAELLAMRKAAKALGRRRLSGCSLYVTLEPCPMCAGAMLMAEMERCYFGAFDARQGCCGSIYDLTNDPSFYHRVETAGGLCEAEASELLKAFFQNKRDKRAEK